MPGLRGCLGPGSWGAMWAGREGLAPPGSRLALVGADCVYTFPAHSAHARLLFPGPLPPLAACTICTFAALAAESCLPQPRTPLQEAPGPGTTSYTTGSHPRLRVKPGLRLDLLNPDHDAVPTEAESHSLEKSLCLEVGVGMIREGAPSN